MSSEGNATVTYQRAFSLSAPRERVFMALTDADQLRRWFAEHVEVEPRVGGAYRFWGKHTLWTLRREDADQVITRIESPTRLAFDWTWRGAPGNVDLDIQSADNGAKLAVRHTLASTIWPIGDEARFVAGDMWVVAVGNLRAFLTNGSPALRPDFSQTSGDVRQSIEIAAPPERVFQALTDPQQMDKWLSRGAKVEPRAGGRYDYGWTSDNVGGCDPMGPMKIIEIVPNRRIVHDWHYHGVVSRVCWELEPRGGKTVVTLTHTKFDDDITHGGFTQGWSAFLLMLRELTQDNPGALAYIAECRDENMK